MLPGKSASTFLYSGRTCGAVVIPGKKILLVVIGEAKNFSNLHIIDLLLNQCDFDVIFKSQAIYCQKNY